MKSFLFLIFISIFIIPVVSRAHSVSEWLTAENIARLKRGEFLNDEEKDAWLKLNRTPGVLRKIIEYTHPEYVRSKSLRDGILREILGPIEESTTEIDAGFELTLNLEDLPGMSTFLAAHVRTEEEIKELQESLATRVAQLNDIVSDIGDTLNETVKQASTDCPN